MSRFASQAERMRNRGYGAGIAMTLVLFLVATAGVAWVYMGMITSDRWPIRWLEIDGAFERVSAEQVRANLEPIVMGSFFTVDLDAVRASTQRLAWVSSVSVQKNWPDTVRVTVDEYIALAHWTGGRLISSAGSLFAVPGAEEMQGLPWLEGPQGMVDLVYETWQQFNNELLPAGLEIERLHLDRRGAWYLVLTSGTEVHIGREDALPRLRRMVGSWGELVKQNNLAPLGVDLRYTNGFAVRWPKPPPRLAKNSD